MTNEEILNNLRDQLRAEIREEIRAELIANLGGSAPVAVAATVPAPASKAKTSKPKAPKAKTKAKGEKRAPEEIAKTMSSVLSYVKQHPGSNAEAIKKSLGVELSVVVLPIQKLLASRAITRKGHRRATRYYPGKVV